jgi:uncharacterized protein (UPF0332 family)
MPFDFNEFLTLAEDLAAKADEASKRSSISRAYYTAYHLAFPRAETTVGSYSRRKDNNRSQQHRDLSTHAWCWRQYMDTNDVNCTQIGLDGDRMKRRRHIADYNRNDITNLEAEARRQIEDARQFKADIAALDPKYPQP